jgi:hypothetical protein
MILEKLLRSCLSQLYQKTHKHTAASRSCNLGQDHSASRGCTRRDHNCLSQLCLKNAQLPLAAAILDPISAHTIVLQLSLRYPPPCIHMLRAAIPLKDSSSSIAVSSAGLLVLQSRSKSCQLLSTTDAWQAPLPQRLR